jgi:hypothetical protein
MKLTEQSEKWMQSVLANCKTNTGRALPEWVALAKKSGAKSDKEVRAFCKGEGLSAVYQTAVSETLFPRAADDTLFEAQFAGAKAALLPIYEALAKFAQKLGSDVQIFPRKSQITFAREKTFAVVRAATKDRLDVALKLHGEKATPRLVLDKKAQKSDPSHIVSMRSARELDAELKAWLKKAYDRAS